MMEQVRTIGVVGLGYVGLPLAIALGKHFRVIGFDRNEYRIHELKKGQDRTREVSSGELSDSRVEFSADPAILEKVNFFIVSVPTPVDQSKRPDLEALLSASGTVGKYLKKKDIVVYESTVYPGVTEEECLPVLEKASGLRGGVDFFVGYSPERVNPGDKKNTLSNVIKIISAQTQEALEVLEAVYGCVVKAGLYKAPSIKVAEAAKVIENIQRDLNIALMNEIATICHRLDIDTGEVLQAARTKWNFLPFGPGLVGGHCIGVDPYYLTHKAEQLGYHPQVILSGRRINDGMGIYIVQQSIKKMIQNNHNVNGLKALVLGVTFKENVPDLRNSRVPEMVAELQSFGVDVDVHDPLANPEEARREYGLSLSSEWDKTRKYSLILMAVGHDSYKALEPSQLRAMATDGAVFVDVKHLFARNAFAGMGVHHWRI